MIKNFLLILLTIVITHRGEGQVILEADGPGDTYQLITSILAPNYNPIEAPDCNHTEYGEHIDEKYDTDLNDYVFQFHIHTTPDNDRCINLDRQRNEIKAYDKSPDNLLGIENETVIYKWKFKLNEGFQSSPNFTHIHQLKSVGGDLASMPMYTLTTRKGSPDRIELRYAETSNQITLTQSDLAPFIDTWLSVTETIKYGSSGSYSIQIKKVDDDEVLMDYSNPSIINWRMGADFVRPKWGIYRSLINAQDLRDEIVSFANFSIEEVETVSTKNVNNSTSQILISNLGQNNIYIESQINKIEKIELYSIDGVKVLDKEIDQKSHAKLNVSSIYNGTYAIVIKGKKLFETKLITIAK